MIAARQKDVPGREASANARPSHASPWQSFADRRHDRVQKRDAVLRAAAALFLELGYDRASLNEVAHRLNITKPALYNYFRSKDEILLECYRLGYERVRAGIAAADASTQPGLAKVRRFIHDYASLMTEDFGMCLVRVDDRVLAPEDRARIRAEKRRTDEALRRYLADGVKDGSIRPCDPKISAFLMFGALHGIGHWFDPAGELSTAALAGRFADELTAGLTVRSNPRR